MNRTFLFLYLFLCAAFVFWGFWSTFFVQDDYILIDYFAKNSLLVDINHAFGLPEVTHYRPLHNLFFLISGNMFGQNYYLYHLVVFVAHVSSAFFVFKIIEKLFRSQTHAFISSTIYVVHPAHFNSLFWISGSAITFGFLLLLSGVWFLINDRKILSLLFLLISFLASEAMIVGVLIYGIILWQQNKFQKEKGFFLKTLTLSVLFLMVRFLFLTPKETFSVYSLSLSSQTLFAIKYYLLRMLGFVEGWSRSFPTLILLAWLFTLVLFWARFKKLTRLTVLFILITILGFFPFVLIPNHLSPHYLNISIFGFATLSALAMVGIEGKIKRIALVTIFVIISLFSVRLTSINSWVVERAELAEEIVSLVREQNLPNNDVIIFSDSLENSSKEQFVATGGGKAIDLFFSEKNYKTCFTFFEKC